MLHALLKRGIRVPEEVSIIGFDDIEEGRYSAPALTSISPDKHAIARAALDVLQDKGLEARGGQPPFEVPVIPFQLVQRAST